MQEYHPHRIRLLERTKEVYSFTTKQSILIGDRTVGDTKLITKKYPTRSFGFHRNQADHLIMHSFIKQPTLFTKSKTKSTLTTVTSVG